MQFVGLLHNLLTFKTLHSQHAIDILICIYPSGIPIEISFFAESMANRIRSLQRQAPLMPSKLAPGRLVLSSVALACSKSIPYLAQFLWLNKTAVGGRDGGNVYLVYPMRYVVRDWLKSVKNCTTRLKYRGHSKIWDMLFKDSCLFLPLEIS